LEPADFSPKSAVNFPSMKKKPVQRIGILTAGGDSPGLNAAIRAVGKAAISE
jgi:hypothetical protein